MTGDASDPIFLYCPRARSETAASFVCPSLRGQKGTCSAIGGLQNDTFGLIANRGRRGSMTSERRKAANQANARRSTGPQTPEGKAVIRLNALRHGLLARDVVLPGEDADAFEDLWNQVRADLSPMGPIEELLSERVVNAMWRLRRLARAETALLHWRVHWLRADRLAKQVRSYEETLLDRLSFPSDITDKASHTEATEALGQAEDERDRDEVLLGCALDADAKEGDAFGKLARYETSLERSLFRTLYELRQVQDERRNRRPSPILDAVALNAGGT